MRDPDGLLCGVSDELRGRVSDDDVLLIARALEARHRSRRLRSFGGGVAVGLALTALATATTSLLSSTGGAAASPASVMTTTRRGSRALLSSTTDAVNWGSAFFAPVGCGVCDAHGGGGSGGRRGNRTGTGGQQAGRQTATKSSPASAMAEAAGLSLGEVSNDVSHKDPSLNH